MIPKRLCLLATFLTFFAAGCEEGSTKLDGTTTQDMAVPTGDASLDPDLSAPGDLNPSEPTPTLVKISTSGHDRFLNVAYDASGSFYAVGYVTAGTDANTDFSTVVAKFNVDGTLDTTWAQGGYAVKNIASGTSGEVARGIVIQSTGKIVVSATVEAPVPALATDRDLALIRFNADGTLDTTFGTMGVELFSLSTGEPITGGFIADSTYGLTKYPGADDRMILMSTKVRDVGATDSDFAVVRVTADGDLDATFDGDGIQTLNIMNMATHLSASPRSASILADGSIIATGYLTDTEDNNIVKPVVFKLTSVGAFDTTFGGGDGVFHQTIQGHTTEVYGAVLQGDKLLTFGYGKDADADDLDWVSLRLNADGTLDTTYGTDGKAIIDHGGFNDNARNILLLPSGKILIVGGGRVSASDSNAAIALLNANGTIDTAFGTDGRKSWDFGGASDFFWGAALSPDGTKVAMVGTKQVAAGMGNDDGVVYVIPVP